MMGFSQASCAESSTPTSTSPTPLHTHTGEGGASFLSGQEAQSKEVQQRGQRSSFHLGILLDLPNHQLHAGGRILA